MSHWEEGKANYRGVCVGLHPGIGQAVRPRLPPCLCALLCLSYFLFYFEDGLFALNLVLPVFVLHLGYLLL